MEGLISSSWLMELVSLPWKGSKRGGCVVWGAGPPEWDSSISLSIGMSAGSDALWMARGPLLIQSSRL